MLPAQIYVKTQPPSHSLSVHLNCFLNNLQPYWMVFLHLTFLLVRLNTFCGENGYKTIKSQTLAAVIELRPPDSDVRMLTSRPSDHLVENKH